MVPVASAFFINRRILAAAVLVRLSTTMRYLDSVLRILEMMKERVSLCVKAVALAWSMLRGLYAEWSLS